MKKKVICDCDNTFAFKGRPMDDALALMYLMGREDDIELLGIASNYGNGTAEDSLFCNTLMLTETGYTHIPVYSGCEKDEDCISEASRFVCDMADRYADDLVYLGIGSLGNLYGAYLIDNTVFDKIGQIVLMGGITEPLFIHDNLALDELNFSINAEASALVLSKGRNISVITGNNCLPVSELPKDEFLDKLCSSDNPAGMYIARKCGYRFQDKKLVYGADSSYCWDAVAAAYITNPELFADHPTPCLINEREIREKGFLHPCSEEEAVNTINIPAARDRVTLQNCFYESWLSLKMHTSDANFSCKGLYLDKLIQPCILIELSNEPCHGFRLMQRIINDGYADSSLDPAGFYRNLKRMEEEGYLTHTAEGSGPKAKKTFYITDFGRRALLNWQVSLRKYGRHIEHIINEIDNC